MNTLVSPSDLVEFGQFSDLQVDVAAASVRREAGWHVAPRLVETVNVPCRGGRELLLPSRAFSDAPVVVSAVHDAGCLLGGWEPVGGALWRRAGWPAAVGAVDLTHGFDVCPPDLLPVLAQRADAARSPRDSRVTSFTIGAVGVVFEDAARVDPSVAGYAVIGGVALPATT